MTKLGLVRAMVACGLFATFSVAPATAQNRPVVIGGTLGLTGPFAGPAVEYKAVNEQYPPTTTDFTRLVRKAKAANANLLLALGLPNDRGRTRHGAIPLSKRDLVVTEMRSMYV